MIQAYASTIDTANWVILLLIFELQTSVIPDHRLVGNVRRGLTLLQLVCYSIIAFALYGYIVKYIDLLAFSPIDVDSLCVLVKSAVVVENPSNPLSFMLPELDEYAHVTASNCATLPSELPFLQNGISNVLTDTSAYTNAHSLALIDVINASSWLLVVLMLLVDVELQMRSGVAAFLTKIMTASKVVLYSILLICAALWGFWGDFLDFWDAFLWIVAFVFIEMNMFDWRAETASEKRFDD